MVCSFGDQNDVSVFRELGLKPFQAIDLEGKMTEISGPLHGHTVLDAKLAISILEDTGKLSSKENRLQDIPVSERGSNPVEIILLKEWYVKQTHVIDRLSELSENCNFIPERNRQFLRLDGRYLHRLAHKQEKVVSYGSPHLVLRRLIKGDSPT